MGMGKHVNSITVVQFQTLKSVNLNSWTTTASEARSLL